MDYFEIGDYLVDPKCQHKYPYKKQAEEDLTHKEGSRETLMRSLYVLVRFTNKAQQIYVHL